MTTTSNDRELLELAAKAANYKLVFDYDANFQGPCIIDLEGFPEQWNPMEDHGDALRLGVKTNVIGSPLFHHYLALERCANQGHDDLIATCRAITRAAAESVRAI